MSHKTDLFSDENIFKVKHLCNSHNVVIYVLKKIRKIEVPKERLLCEIEVFPKQIKVSVEISKAGKLWVFFAEPNTKVNAKYCCNVLLKKMIPEMNRLATHNEYLFMHEGSRDHTAKLTINMLKDKKQFRLLISIKIQIAQI